MIIPEPLPPLPYLPEELHDVAERHGALLDRERAARAEVQRARQAVPVAEAEDRRRQVDAIRNGGTARDAGWDRRDEAREALAEAEAEQDAVLALIQATRREFVQGVRVHLAEMLDRAQAEVEQSATEYQAAIATVLDRRVPYAIAFYWLDALRRFAEDDRATSLRWMSEADATRGVIHFQGRSVRGDELDVRHLRAVLEADSTRHVPKPARKPTADDRRLAADLARATGGRLKPAAE